MVPTPNGKGVVLIGGYNDSEFKYSDKLLELSGHCVERLSWIVLDQRLQYARKNHVAFPIPDSLTKPLDD